MAGGPAVLRFARGLPATKQFGERLRLLVRQGKDQGTCYSLLGDTVLIGREDCQINLADTNISRRHAEITWRGDHYVLRDLGSQNGVVYNGAKTAEAKLSPGDIFLMGLTVIEVYPSGQVRKTEKPRLAAPLQPITAGPVTSAKSPEQKKVERNRLLMIVVVFFLLAAAYFSDDTTTIRERSKIEQAEDVDTPGQKKGKPADNSAAQIAKADKQILAMKEQLAKVEKRRAELEQRSRTSKSLSSDALDDQMSAGANTQQRKDAEVFFRSGVREKQNRNFRRAFTAFETALTVDPTHELAKIYLKSAKMELLSELWGMQAAGLRAKSSLRYNEARMNFENIVRYLDVENGTSTMESDENKQLKDLLDDAKKELDDLDRLENKSK